MLVENSLISVDYIIVGAGSAGCVLANRLSAGGEYSVLVLEAGGRDWHPYIHMPVGFLKALQKPSLTWGYKSEPEPHLNGRVLPLPRGRVLGGSSSINGMFHIRGHRHDFDEWSNLGCRGWSYAEVLPYFKRSENSWRGQGKFHGASGPLEVNPIDTSRLMAEPLRSAAVAAGYTLTDDYDGEHPEGFARGEVAINTRGRRVSSARAYLHPAMARPNLSVICGARTQRIMIDNSRAVGVEYIRNGKLIQVRAKREVILSGGTYNSPQLLMLSGVGPAEELHKHGITVLADLQGVGRNLIEHPRMALQFDAAKPVTFINELRFDRALVSTLRWAFQGKGAFASQICSGTLLLRTRPDLDRPDIQLLCNPVRLDAGVWFPGVNRRPQHSFYITVCQLHAKSRGYVTLRSRDPQEAPKVFLNLFSNPDDFASMREGVRAARKIYRCAPQAELTGKESVPGESVISDDQLDAAIRKFGAITHHPVGTCRMGVGEDAVVDAQLRVHGIQALRVVDASVMPTIPGGNTNAATIMIAEKAADLILGRALAPEAA